MSSAAAYYERQKEHYSGKLAEINRFINRIARSRLFVMLLAVIVGIYAAKTHQGNFWWLTVGLCGLFLALVRIHQQAGERRNVILITLSLIENEMKALSGDYSPFATGGEFFNTGHPYTYDLDIFGKGSIFQMLCRTVTGEGHGELAKKLSTPVKEVDDIINKQNIIKELSALPDFLLDLRVAGSVDKEQGDDSERVRSWLSGGDLFISDGVARVLVALIPALTAVCAVYSFLRGAMTPFFSLVVIVNWVILGVYQKKIKRSLAEIGGCEDYIDKTERILKAVHRVSFTNEWLKHTAANAGSSLRVITRFRSHARLLDSRENVFIGPTFNSLFLFDLYCLVRLEYWRKKHGRVLLTAMDHIRELDAVVSLGVYAFNNPDNPYPIVTSGQAGFFAADLRHPLIPAAVAVGNDVSLGKNERLYLLTGANMTGKSTFIRAIGVCHVMTLAGLPVPASRCELPLTDLYTSMRITDSVQDDISYFRAELNRISFMVEQVKTNGRPCMVLLDEPLRGTNSADKQQGTRAIMETLITHNATGIVATHDTLLSDMENIHPGKVSNYHFESMVTEDGLSFDFKLKQGVSTSNNATVLMKRMGIIP